MKTDPKSNHPFKSCHAEYNAIKNCDPETLKGATLYVYRENRKGEVVNSKPCVSCMTLIQRVGIKRVFYSHSNSAGYELITCKLFSNNTLFK